jgi:hypothetical protein
VGKAGHVTVWERRGADVVEVVTSEGRRLLGRTRRRWEYNINMELKWVEGVWTGFIWVRIGSSGGRL